MVYKNLSQALINFRNLISKTIWHKKKKFLLILAVVGGTSISITVSENDKTDFLINYFI